MTLLPTGIFLAPKVLMPKLTPWHAGALGQYWDQSDSNGLTKKLATAAAPWPPLLTSGGVRLNGYVSVFGNSGQIDDKYRAFARLAFDDDGALMGGNDPLHD